jgi:hypothetical protein
MNNNIENFKNLSIVFENLPQNVYGFICEIKPKTKCIVINETLDFCKMEIVIYAFVFFYNNIGVISEKNFNDPIFEPISLAKQELKKNCTQNFTEV